MSWNKEGFFISTLFQSQTEIPVGFISTMRKPCSFTLKLYLKCKPKSYWGKKKKKKIKKKKPALIMKLTTRGKQRNKNSTVQLHAALPGPLWSIKTRGASHQCFLYPCAQAEPHGPSHFSHLFSRTPQFLHCPQKQNFASSRSYYHQVKQNWLLLKKLFKQ